MVLQQVPDSLPFRGVPELRLEEEALPNIPAGEPRRIEGLNPPSNALQLFRTEGVCLQGKAFEERIGLLFGEVQKALLVEVVDQKLRRQEGLRIVELQTRLKGQFLPERLRRRDDLLPKVLVPLFPLAQKGGLVIPLEEILDQVEVQRVSLFEGLVLLWLLPLRFFDRLLGVGALLG